MKIENQSSLRPFLYNLGTYILVLIFLSGCSLLPNQIDETKNWNAAKIYSRAKRQLDKGSYELAIKYYEKLEARFPFGKYAQQAQLEIAYAYYKNDDFPQALTACNRFIKLHPSHPRVDYLYYLKGLVNYRKKKGLFEKMFPVDPATRDPGAARQAFFDFKELLKKFPRSQYAKDASKRMLKLRNNLAKHEVIVAQYYLDRGVVVGAVNRSKFVLENYEGSPSVETALVVMYKAYKKLGLTKLAQDTKRILALNYPRNPLITGIPAKKSLMRRVFKKSN